MATLSGGLWPVLVGRLGRAGAGSRAVLALFITAVICVACLFLMGSARSFFTGKNAFRSGIEMTVVGSVVALITYAVGYGFRTA